MVSWDKRRFKPTEQSYCVRFSLTSGSGVVVVAVECLDHFTVWIISLICDGSLGEEENANFERTDIQPCGIPGTATYLSRYLLCSKCMDPLHP